MEGGLHYLSQASSKCLVLGPTREVDFNRFVLFCFCFYYGADVYVMFKKVICK